MSKLAKCIAVQHVSVAHVDEAKICFLFTIEHYSCWSGLAQSVANRAGAVGTCSRLLLPLANHIPKARCM